jgi:hypothetical protein
LARSDFTSIAGAASAMVPDPKTPEAPPSLLDCTDEVIE